MVKCPRMIFLTSLFCQPQLPAPAGIHVQVFCEARKISVGYESVACRAQAARQRGLVPLADNRLIP